MLHVISLNQYPILEQLQLEEALLRTDDRNWCLINHGTPPAIVLGISGKPELLINRDVWSKSPCPLIRRFSGGGTVIVDEETIFVTFIINSDYIPIDPYPESIMGWAGKIYQSVFQHKEFKLQENDYVIGEKKCGGNAQYLCKKRWLNHTSFLWDYRPERMNTLTLPHKKPSYRGTRSHEEFLFRLKEIIPSRVLLQKRLMEELHAKFPLKMTDISEVLLLSSQPHRRSTTFINEF